MKTNAFKYLGIALMALMMISLTSCEVEIDSFYDDDNIGGGYYSRCCQELDFYLDRTGVDYIRVEYRNGDVEVFEYNFRWNWENYAQTSIRMSYGPGDVSYLDDVYLGGNRLSGYLDGRDNFVEYQGSR